MPARSHSILALAATVCLGAGAFAEAAPSFTVGEPFPAIVLPSVDAAGARAPMSIADFRGRKIVLHMFASW